MKKTNQTAGQTALKYALLLDYSNYNILISPKEGGKFFTSKEEAEAAIQDHQGIGGTGFTVIPFSASEEEFLRSFRPMPFIEDEAGLRAALEEWFASEDWIRGEEWNGGEYFQCYYAHKLISVYPPYYMMAENITVEVGGEKRYLEYGKYARFDGWKVVWQTKELAKDIFYTIEGLIG